MSNTNPELVEKFTAMAKAVAATVAEVPNREEAFKYIIDLTLSKEPCELLADEPGTEKGPLGPNRVPTRVQRVIAAPSLDDEAFAELDKLCQEKGILCLRDNVRKYAAGIDLGLNEAVAGVAASGTCLCPTTDENVRLAGMISEISVLTLKKSAIYPDLPSVAHIMRASFTTLITGPSRTADIECVGAVGVHGPLALHILLLED